MISVKDVEPGAARIWNYTPPGSLATSETNTPLEEEDDQQDDENQKQDSTTDVHAAASFRCEFSPADTRSAAETNPS